ncbi:MAG: hypothetical protein Q8858_07365 [Bacteroidota bacterium]|nr:hypothetical protein [Bacteroidota bacterium]
MKFSDETLEFINGNKFSNSLYIPISLKEKSIPTRIDFVENLIQSKKIIHLGCVDHLSSLESKLKSNTWFHKRLMDKATRCFGIDINREGIEYIRKIGFDDVIYLDIAEDDVPFEIKNEKWDYLVLGEILEHIDNPVFFLSSIREKYKAYVDKVIITVPFAFRLLNFRNVLKHKEFINSDHRFWFTPYTLAKVTDRSGMKVETFNFVHSYKPSRFSLVNKFLLTRYPALRDTLVLIAHL